MSQAVFTYITTPNKVTAQKIAKTLLQENLIACANILPEMESIFNWQGQTQKSNECVLILKSQERHSTKIKERVLALHSYSCPCVVSWPIPDGHSDFLQWIFEETNK